MGNVNGMTPQEAAARAKEDSFTLAALPGEKRDAALTAIAEALEAEKAALFAANGQDLEDGKTLPAPILGRLKFDDHKLDSCLAGIRDLIAMDDPVGKSVFKRQLADGLVLEKVTCPIGVIGVIFESRPDALVQILALCLKSGNAVLLKGGSEAKHTNRALFDVIHAAGVAAGLPEAFATLIEDRAAITELLACDDSIDLIIPRGSNAFVKCIMDNSRIPVMGHADGICHIYVDKDADLAKAVPVILDAKTQYVAACNAVETLLVHRAVAPQLMLLLEEAAAAANKANNGHPVELIEAADDSDYVEYLDYKLTTKIVDSIEEAIAHINRYGSHHTDAILTEDAAAADLFMTRVDSAGVYHNCSTRFADGYRYGFGAEVGISTGKLHARGPVGLDGLLTYKYKLCGHGDIVADFADGTRVFDFKDL